MCSSDRRVRQKQIESSDVLAVKVASSWETCQEKRRGGRGGRFLVFYIRSCSKLNWRWRWCSESIQSIFEYSIRDDVTFRCVMITDHTKREGGEDGGVISRENTELVLDFDAVVIIVEVVFGTRIAEIPRI